MMGALLVALAATAVFKGIDGANALSGGSKSRAIAASIAEDDQERMRALPPADLVDRNETRTLTRSGVAYTVASSTKWVADRDATPDCNTTTSRAGYLRIRTQVTWPDMRGSKPIVASSLVAPPNGTVTSNRGALGVKILNEANTGVPGVSVSVSGAGLSGTTDANGCVYWDGVPQGNYSYTAQKTGLVDYNGETSITRPIGVSGGQTRLDTAYLDVATGMNATFVTRRYGAAEIALADLAESMPMHLTNAKMNALNGVLSTPASTSSTRSLTGLYPMPYGVFGGPCALANNPASYTVASAATPAYNPVAAAYQVSPPYTPTRPYLPSINVRGYFQGAYRNGYTVKFYLQPVAGSSCTVTYSRTTQNVTGVGDGAIARPELPYGRYTVCGEAFYSGAWWKASKTVDNTSTGGVSVLLDDSNAVQGRCP